NYQPLSHAQAIKTGRTRSLGLVLQLSDHDAQRPFLAEFLAGVSAGASKEGYTLTLASADTDAAVIASFRALLKDGKADGFVLPRAMVSDHRVKFLRDLQVPFVLYGRQEQSDGCAWFDIRGEEAMRRAVVHLAGLGHRRIAFVNGGAIYTYAALRRDGFERGMSECGLIVDPALIASDAVTQEDGQREVARFLAQPEPPTAVVCAVDQVALGAYQAVRALGLKVGRDVSITGYDGIADGARAKPQLTTFAVNNSAAGESLATLLIRRIRGEAPETLRETEDAIFLDRGSTGPVKGE
ncbi:MAG: substrate-binding domain-containing protein, partial [Pseudomonadota bacterium]